MILKNEKQTITKNKKEQQSNPSYIINLFSEEK